MNNNKGFTVIELILSFVLVMFVALSMFTVVTNYFNRQEKEVVKKNIRTFKSTLVMDIEKDFNTKRLKKMAICTAGVANQCVDITFMDNTTKRLMVESLNETITDSGSTFTIPSFQISYGGVKYKNPDPKFANVKAGQILTFTKSTDTNPPEYGVIYRINIVIEHEEYKNDFVIRLVATGVE